MAEPVISVADLRMRYRGAAHDAVDSICFDVWPGEVFGLLGPNGAGKSTTQKILTKLLRGYEGQALVFGESIDRWGADYYERVGVGFELPAHYSRLTARENLVAFASLYSGPTADAMALLDAVELVDVADRPVAEFSKGMQMRLGLARALVNEPDLLFLDEPTSGMDPVHATQVRELIAEQAQRGRTVFVTTHDMATVDQLCDRVAFMVDGQIRAIDSPRGFRLTYGQRQVEVEYRTDGRVARTHFGLDELGTDAGFLELARSGLVETIHTREASLDEVFVAVTGGGL